MSKLLLLVQSQDDVAHLDAAARAILNSAITGVWVVFSPAITVNASEAAAKLDTEIAQLRAAERQAADRSDYEAAKGYKVQREGKELDRATALRNAWKTAPEEDRKKKVSEIFQPFLDVLQPKGLNVKVTGHSDHYDREQWVQMLNSLTGVWFKPFAPGSFVVAWPESVETSIKAGLETVAPGVMAPIPVSPEDRQKFREQSQAAQPTPARKATLSREEELRAMKFMSLKAVAKKVGVEIEGKKVPQIIAEVLAHEAKLASTPSGAPTTVEEY